MMRLGSRREDNAGERREGAGRGGSRRKGAGGEPMTSFAAEDREKAAESAGGKRSRKKPWQREVFEWVQILAVAAVLAFVLNTFIIANSWVPSESMENTIRARSRVVGFRLSYLFEEPERGDVVIFKFPDDESVNYVKRIIGLPGETVDIRDGKVYINGSEEPLSEPYLPEPMLGSFGPYVVPEDCYFMMGDNRNHSGDARFWKNTYLHKDKMIAKVIFSYYPTIKMIDGVYSYDQ